MKKEVNLYVFPASPDTDKIKNYLSSRGIAFKVYDMDSDRKARRHMLEVTRGECSAPVIEIGERIICGLNKKRLDDTIDS